MSTTRLVLNKTESKSADNSYYVGNAETTRRFQMLKRLQEGYKNKPKKKR